MMISMRKHKGRVENVIVFGATLENKKMILSHRTSSDSKFSTNPLETKATKSIPWHLVPCFLPTEHLFSLYFQGSKLVPYNSPSHLWLFTSVLSVSLSILSLPCHWPKPDALTTVTDSTAISCLEIRILVLHSSEYQGYSCVPPHLALWSSLTCD